MDVLLLYQFTTWTFRTFARFDTKTFRYLPGRCTTCPKVRNLRYCKNLSSGGETSTEVAKRPGIETSKWRTGKVANRPVTLTSPYRRVWLPKYMKQQQPDGT